MANQNEILEMINQGKALLTQAADSSEDCQESLGQIEQTISEFEFPSEMFEGLADALAEDLGEVTSDYLESLNLDDLGLDSWAEEVSTEASECVMTHVGECVERTSQQGEKHAQFLQQVVNLSSLKRSLDGVVERWPKHIEQRAESAIESFVGGNGLEQYLLSLVSVNEQTVKDFSSNLKTRMESMVINIDTDIDHCFQNFTDDIKDTFKQAVETPFKDLVADVPQEFMQAVVTSMGVTQVSASVNSALAPYAPQIAIAVELADAVSDAMVMSG